MAISSLLLLNDFFNSTIPIDSLSDSFLKEKNIQVDVLRLDLIHPEISGNKIFKLKLFLEQALKSSNKIIVTFGGAYSNHLAATAVACKTFGLKSIAFVRGEKAPTLSHTLALCEENGMQLKFISRAKYREKNSTHFINEITNEIPNAIIIPEGGFSHEGALGAADILDYIPENKYDFIGVSVGTGTTLAGLLQRKSKNQIIGFGVLKNQTDVSNRIKSLLGKEFPFHFINDFHFGGFAKHTAVLIDFMNRFYLKHNIPLDFVYTGKMMYGIFQMIEYNYFPKGARILCIHTGGLQGNKSLPSGKLLY